MGLIRKYKAGEFCWCDIDSANTRRSKKFYGAIFGWKALDTPGGPTGPYSLMRVGGKDVAGMYAMLPAERKKKVKTSWLPFIAVKSASATAKKAKAAGAKITEPVKRIGDSGTMAILKDPAGAEFAVWQAASHIGAGVDGKPGCVSWHDLSVKDTTKAGAFYTKVFGWKHRTQDMGGGKYHTFEQGREGVAGMWPEGMKKFSPCWITHFKVADCGKAAATAKKLGGRVHMPPMRISKTMSFAILADPDGAAFGVIGR